MTDRSAGNGSDVRERLVRLLEEHRVDFDFDLGDDASLIRSGFIDSVGLYNLALWIENEVGSEIDLAAFDATSRWDTVADILRFIGKFRE